MKWNVRWQPAIRREDFLGDLGNTLLLRPVYRISRSQYRQAEASKTEPEEVDNRSGKGSEARQASFSTTDDDEIRVAAYLARHPKLPQEFFEDFPEVKAAYLRKWGEDVHDLPLSELVGMTERSPNVPSVVNQTIELPPELVGQISGPRGAITRRIAQENGVDIESLSDGVIITGDPVSVEAAMRQITNLAYAPPLRPGAIHRGRVIEANSERAVILLPGGRNGLLPLSELLERLPKGAVAHSDSVVVIGQPIVVKIREITEGGEVGLLLIAVSNEALR